MLRPRKMLQRLDNQRCRPPKHHELPMWMGLPHSAGAVWKSAWEGHCWSDLSSATNADRDHRDDRILRQEDSERGPCDDRRLLVSTMRIIQDRPQGGHLRRHRTGRPAETAMTGRRAWKNAKQSCAHPTSCNDPPQSAKNPSSLESCIYVSGHLNVDMAGGQRHH